MSVLAGIVVFVIVWWLVFFTTLPWGVRSPHEAGLPVEPGHAPSAPVRPRLWLKAAVTTAITAVIWIIVYIVIDRDWVSFRTP
ncbi:MAG: DUF1467 family protein [Alphaproteobacteria bacterium]|nr:DUF1467 family protein [Alphaproteobacteria bacterium]